VVIISLISPAGWSLTALINKLGKFSRWAKVVLAIFSIYTFANLSITLFGNKAIERDGQFMLVPAGSHSPSSSIGDTITESEYHQHQANELRATSGRAMGVFLLMAIFIWNGSPKHAEKPRPTTT
jgi:hypothetical protein